MTRHPHRRGRHQTGASAEVHVRRSWSFCAYTAPRPEVDPRKDQRLRQSFAEFDGQSVEWRLALERHDVKNLVAMGPSGHHLDEAELETAVAALPEVSAVSAAVSVTVLQHRR